MKIITTPTEFGGCEWYRSIQFRRSANAQGIANVQEVKPNKGDKMIEEMFSQADAFYIRFQNDTTINVFKTFKRLYPTKPIIFDTDDDLDTCNPFNEAYSRFGTGEVKLEGKGMLWEHSKANFNMYENRRRLEMYHEMMHEADIVTTTTMRLANKLKEYNKATAVIPNAINPELFPVLDQRRGKEIRLTYSGGASHYEDLAAVKGAFSTLMDKYPNLHLYIVGQTFKGIIKDLPEDRVHTYGWLKPDGHGYRLASLDPDIAIAPLNDQEFNRNKSCIKWYEFSALKVPMVLSDVPPYSDEVQDGKTGLLFKGEGELVKKVSELIDDPLKATKIAQNAHDWVIEHRSIDKVTKTWVELFKNIIEAKKPKSEAKGLK